MVEASTISDDQPNSNLTQENLHENVLFDSDDSVNQLSKKMHISKKIKSDQDDHNKTNQNAVSKDQI